MKIAYTVLEVDRHENANLIRSKLSFLDEMITVVCDARKEYPNCINKYPEYKHIFNSITNIGFIGLWISNLNAFYNLLDSDYDAILIFEDDAVPVENFQEKFETCIKELPQDFSIFSVGYRDVYLNNYTEKHLVGKKNICKMFQTGDSWAILYNKAFVKEMLNAIVKHKILGGLPDAAIMSYALGNVSPITKFNPYNPIPLLGSFVTHNCSEEASSIANAPNISEYIK